MCCLAVLAPTHLGFRSFAVGLQPPLPVGCYIEIMERCKAMDMTNLHHGIYPPVKFVSFVQAQSFEKSGFGLALSQCWSGRCHVPRLLYNRKGNRIRVAGRGWVGEWPKFQNSLSRRME